MKGKEHKPPNANKMSKIVPITLLCLIICGFSFYLGGIYGSEKIKYLAKLVAPLVQYRKETGLSPLQIKPPTFFECSPDYQDYTPCIDPKRWRKYGTYQLTLMERHCPTMVEREQYLIPSPDGYKLPIRRPKSKDECWYRLPAQYQIRELHRRMVDFIKRRYLLLEKALNAEYCLAQIGYTRPPESGKQDSKAEHNDTEMPLSFSLMKGLPLLEPITAEEVVYDNKPGCLELSRLYNRMLRVVDDNAIDAVKAHIGDPSVGFCCQIETIYDGLQRILTGPEMSSAASAQA